MGTAATAYSSMSDGQLWAAIQASDTDAFETIFTRYVDRVWRHCYVRLGNRHDADEVTSQTFLTAYQKRHSVRIVDDVTAPWLLTIASNMCKNAQRSNQRRYSLEFRVASVSHAVADHEVDDRLAAEEQRTELRAALSKLPDRLSETVWLCVVEELPHREVAAALDIPVGTVKSRVHRGLLLLRRDFPQLDMGTPPSKDEKG